MPESVTLTPGSYDVGLVVEGVLRNRYMTKIRRVADIILAVIAFVVFLPVMVLCALIVKITNGGPAFYAQLRTGKHGKLFNMYKLRTMYNGAERTTGPIWASANDPRVIRGCRWMRISHIDELPQLINVLAGQMSLIGPRPERPEITNDLTMSFPDFPKRLVTLPRITGLAQIRNGYDNDLESIRRKLDRDLEYIKNRTWSVDLRILFATLGKFYDKNAC